MAITAPLHRRPAATRRVGYAVTAVVNAALLYVVNAWPGWQALPFLTEDARQVLELVNLLLVAGLAAHVDYLTYDAPWTRSLGDLVTTGIGLAVLVRVWQVFPFTFAGSAAGSVVVRLVLAVAIVGSAIGTVAHLVALVRHGVGGGGAHAGRRSTGR